MSVEKGPQLPTYPNGTVKPLYGESPFTLRRIGKGLADFSTASAIPALGTAVVGGFENNANAVVIGLISFCVAGLMFFTGDKFETEGAYKEAEETGLDPMEILKKSGNA